LVNPPDLEAMHKLHVAFRWLRVARREQWPYVHQYGPKNSALNYTSESYQAYCDLTSIPDGYIAAHSFPWDRRGCDWKIEFEPIHYNSEERVSPWQPVFSWVPWLLGVDEK